MEKQPWTAQHSSSTGRVGRTDLRGLGHRGRMEVWTPSRLLLPGPGKRRRETRWESGDSRAKGGQPALLEGMCQHVQEAGTEGRVLTGTWGQGSLSKGCAHDAAGADAATPCTPRPTLEAPAQEASFLPRGCHAFPSAHWVPPTSGVGPVYIYPACSPAMGKSQENHFPTQLGLLGHTPDELPTPSPLHKLLWAAQRERL